MNNYNRVLDALNGIFGYDDQVKSTFRKVRQFFDERNNEEVVIIEYRVRRDDLSKRKLLQSTNWTETSWDIITPISPTDWRCDSIGWHDSPVLGRS